MAEAFCATTLGFNLYVCDDFMEFRTVCCAERVYEESKNPTRYYCGGSCGQVIQRVGLRIPFHFFKGEEAPVLESFVEHFADCAPLEATFVVADLLEEIAAVRAHFREYNLWRVRRTR